MIENLEFNPDRTIIEDSKFDSDLNSLSEFAIMAENHLQKNEGKLRNCFRKEYNVQKLTKQAFGKALVYFEKNQFIPNNGDIYFALSSIEAVISFQIINLLYLFPKLYKEARAKYWDNWEPAFRK
jgi:NDP-sugar pyrophosphorylase family protein